jgi:hypothetical protein
MTHNKQLLISFTSLIMATPMKTMTHINCICYISLEVCVIFLIPFLSIGFMTGNIQVQSHSSALVIQFTGSGILDYIVNCHNNLKCVSLSTKWMVLEPKFAVLHSVLKNISVFLILCFQQYQHYRCANKYAGLTVLLTIGIWNFLKIMFKKYAAFFNPY